ncbi:MAG: 23S rRNA (uracil(1939)-C(5))-methyltransferase RlmD [Gammaproteobacteria bacterium]|nr:23S rRNA (uracil(1939)-C(5))-methyltransferase RlmD [Gammaproteobacteria bacterium]
MSQYHRTKTPQELSETVIGSLSHDGRGIAQINNKVTFIRDALPQEKVLFQYIRCRNRFDEGETIEVLQPSILREYNTCPYYQICGGCSLQHLKYSEQIRHKSQIVLEQLKHFGRVEPMEIMSPITASTFGYRSKARLSVRFVHKKKSVLVGFHEKNGRYIADIWHCSILHPKISEKIGELRSLIASLNNCTSIAQIEAAVGDDGMAFVFRHLEEISHEDLKKLVAFAEHSGIHLYLQPEGLDSIQKIYPKEASDLLKYILPEENIELFFHPTDFTQINHEINQKMVSTVMKLLELEAQDHVLDLFCGLGNFTIPLAKYCADVVGVEGNKKMVDRAKNNAKHNGIHNSCFYVSDLTKNILDQEWANKNYSKIVLDPPRPGALDFINQMQRFSPSKIVYISCNSSTLARDAGVLVHQHGYQLQKIGILDMFPHTSHVETIALFDKNRSFND